MLEFDEGDEIEVIEFDGKTQDGYWLGRCRGKVCVTINYHLIELLEHLCHRMIPTNMERSACPHLAGGLFPFGSRRATGRMSSCVWVQRRAFC